ncbi:MAG: hypothetical protein H7320_19955 [Ferruginibacter sp.]|nr:hypothetical protein [Ferruginibacter sp.]
MIRGMVLLIYSCCFLYSCIYKAGNRFPDIDYRFRTSVNTLYIEKFLKYKWSKNIYESPLTSELINYPKDFIPITDSVLGFKYVIEDRVSEDSINNEGYGLTLASIYDFKKGHWVTDRDSLKNGELEKFELFFKDSVLAKVVQQYKNKIPDSLLFIDKPGAIEIKPLK